MRPLLYIFLVATCAATGCTTRPIYDAAGAAGGGILAHELSDGDPFITGAGAAGGVLLAEGVQHLSAQGRKKAYRHGYDQGRSDAVKEQYWLQQRAQAQDKNTASLRTYTVEGRTVTPTADGDIRLVPHDVVIPILE